MRSKIWAGLSVFKFQSLKVQFLYLVSRFFQSTIFAEIISPALQHLLRVTPKRNSVLFLITDPSMWRFDEAIRYLSSVGIECEVGIAAFGHRIVSGEATVDGLRSVVQAGFTVRVLNFYSISDFVWLHGFETCVFNHPYFLLRSPGSVRSLSRNTKTIYSTYSVGVTEPLHHGEIGKKVLQYAHRIIAETEYVAREISASAPWAKSRICVGGHPSINGIHIVPPVPITEGVRSSILFAPHWTSFMGPDSFRESGIDELSLSFLAIQETDSRVEVTLRPHPRLLENLSTFVSGGVRGLGWNWMRASINPNPIDDFEVSGILVTNSASFIAEFTFTGKPLIFWGKGSQVLLSLNEFGRQCLQVNYVCRSGQEFIEVLRSLLAGHDPKRNAREKFAKEIREEFNGVTFEDALASMVGKGV